MKKAFSVVLAITLLLSLLSGCSRTTMYAVQFDANGGTKVSGQMMQEVEEGADAKEPEVAREGYVFNGWDTSFMNVNSNLVIKAQWIKQVTVTFDAGDGFIVSGDPVQVLEPGMTPEAPSVSRPGYEFDGWDHTVMAVGEEDVIYTAQWTEQKYSSTEIYDMLDESVVEVTVYDKYGSSTALGSGFFIDEEGTLVTNYHVIEGAYSADVTFYNGSTADVLEVLGFSESLDIAILKINVSSSVPIKICDREVVTGEKVYALGSSEGLTGTFSEGIVSNVSRVVDGKQCIQITAPISHGNSGGPCVNEYCEVIGINSMMYTEGQNLNFAIKIHEIEKVSTQGPMTMAELYEYMGYASYTATYASVYGGEGNYTIVTNNDEGEYVYEIGDYVEYENNGTINNADILLNGCWTAGYIDYTEEDIDVYSITLTEECNLYAYILTYYDEDVDLTYAVLFGTDASGELEALADLTPESTEEGTVYLGASVINAPAGTYYLAITTVDDYSYQVGPYYLAVAEWGNF